MRGATVGRKTESGAASDFNSHAPCGAQRGTAPPLLAARGIISTHTPHAGRNSKLFPSSPPHTGHFNSHAPCGAQLISSAALAFDSPISTHTPHAGRNTVFSSDILFIKISTHTPHAGRNPIYCV